jgi:hypothetical protein
VQTPCGPKTHLLRRKLQRSLTVAANARQPALLSFNRYCLAAGAAIEQGRLDYPGGMVNKVGWASLSQPITSANDAVVRVVLDTGSHVSRVGCTPDNARSVCAESTTVA